MKRFNKKKWRRIIGGLFILLLAMIFGWSALSGENDPRFLRLVWDANVETDMSHYEVYFWQGDDSTAWSIPNMNAVGTVPHTVADSIISNQYVMTFNYIRGGAIAVDTQGLRSDMGYSRFYSYEELYAPSSPANVRVIK